MLLIGPRQRYRWGRILSEPRLLHPLLTFLHWPRWFLSSRPLCPAFYSVCRSLVVGNLWPIHCGHVGAMLLRRHWKRFWSAAEATLLQHRRNILPKLLERQQGATKRLPRPSGRGWKKDFSDGHLRRSPSRRRRDVRETLPHASFPLQVPAAATPVLGGRSSHAGVRRARAAFIQGGAIHSGGPPERAHIFT